MAPVRESKKQRKLENKSEEIPLVSGSSEEGSVDWWDELSRKVTGGPSSSHGMDFKYTFKMSRKTFDYICSLVQDHMMAKTHFSFINGDPMSLHDQVGLALRRLGSGNSLISIGESFGTHHSTVSQVTWRFVEAIEQKGPHHIRWPSQQELAKIKSEFANIRGLPNCCGAIDATRITMLLTSSDHEADSYTDRNGAHSMILQAIVDPALRFRDISTGWPGQMSEASVLQGSSFFSRCEKGERLNGDKISETGIREYIVGDSGYPSLPWLVTPYPGRELSENKEELNERILATHSVAKKALARLKECWKMIKADMWRPDKLKLPRFIFVCCILHNIIIEMEDEVFEEGHGEHDAGYKQEVCECDYKGGSILRDKLAMLFSGR